MNYYSFLYSALGSSIFAVYYLIYYMTEHGKLIVSGANTNLLVYVVMLGGIYTIFFIAVALYEKRKADVNEPLLTPKTVFNHSTIECILSIILITCGLFFVYKMYLNENYIFPMGSANGFIRNRVNKNIYSLFVCCLFVLFLFFAKNSGCSKSAVRLAFGALVAALWSILVYAPNPFFDAGGRLYHTHAYTNSIMNVARLQPFDNYNLSIYGHYGLLYLPLVKLLGNNYLAIATSISVFAFITYFCVASACEKIIENDCCYIFSIVAMGITPVMFNTGGQYYQINPHRVLFPAVSLFSVVMFQRKQFSQLTRYIIEIALGTVALIWNVETGLVSIATLELYNILSDFNVERKPFKTGIKCLIFVFSCATFSYLTVNAYSFLTGAHTWMPWKRFIYPIASDTYSISALSMKWPTPYSLFVLQLIVFSLAFMSVLFWHVQKRTERLGDTSIFLACTAFSGLGALSYFANRAAYANIAISCVQMLIITGAYGGEAIIALSSNSIMRKRNRLQLSGKLFMLFCTFIFAVETILLFGITLSNRINTNWKTEDYNHFLTTVDELVPVNTVGMGRGVPELFFQLGRDTRCVLTDWSDMNNENLERAHDILEAHDGYLFINQDSCDEMDNIKDYEIVDKVAFGDEVFILYCKRNAAF